MSSGKHVMYAWITYFLMSYGVAAFYFDIRTGQFRKSRVMRIYGRIICATVFCALCRVNIIYWKMYLIIPTYSKLMNVLVYSQPLISFILFTACMIGSQFKQQSILEMFKDLLRIDNLITESHLCVTPSNRSFLLKLYWVRLLLAIVRTVLFMSRIFADIKNVILHISITGARVVSCGFFFMQFTIVWHICYFFLGLQMYLERLLIEPMSMSRRVQKVLQMHRMYYKLIQMINTFCDIFKYSLALFLIQLGCNACLTGYYFFRKLLGIIQKPNSFTTEAFLILVNAFNVMDLLIFAIIANMVCKLHDETFHILRSSNFASKQLERSVSKSFQWFVKISIVLFILE